MGAYVVAVWCGSSSAYERKVSTKKEALSLCRLMVEEGYQDQEEGSVSDASDKVIARYRNERGKARKMTP